ncbi:unnamed protein product, partial [Oppiella nova]
MPNIVVIRDIIEPQLISSRGFDCENHTVTTDDGYILGIFRIVNNKWKGDTKPILLWHGLGASSDLWLVLNDGQLSRDGIYSEQNGSVVNNCHKELTSNIAFTLSACGYDVWLGNSRGTRYSNTHIDPDMDNFWNYTLTELGVYDVKNTIEYILKQTNKASLPYIGHSMGSTIMFVLLSLEPDFQRYIKPFLAFAPIVFMGNTGSIIRLLTPLVSLLSFLVIPLGLPQELAQFIAQFICANAVTQPICAALMYSYEGFNPFLQWPVLILQNSIPVTIAKSLELSSSKIFLQYGQFILDDRFHKFDYGPIQNIQVYGQPMAPDYPLDKIASNYIGLYKGSNDLLSDLTDVNKLVSRLKVPLVDNYLVPYPLWNHGDPVTSMFDNFFLNGQPQLIESRGFKCEKHLVTTDDGYNIGVFRIINPKWRGDTKPILLWHMLSFSSDVWLFSSPGQLSPEGIYSEQNGSLVNNCGTRLTSNIAFTLSSCGYDVWLGNTRGNQYSNTHQNPSFNNLWNYTFTEVDSIAYIGHSMGTTAMFVLLSLIPKFQRHVKPFI